MNQVHKDGPYRLYAFRCNYESTEKNVGLVAKEQLWPHSPFLPWGGKWELTDDKLQCTDHHPKKIGSYIQSTGHPDKVNCILVVDTSDRSDMKAQVVVVKKVDKHKPIRLLLGKAAIVKDKLKIHIQGLSEMVAQQGLLTSGDIPHPA